MHSTHKRAGMHATAEADGGEDPEPHPPNDELHVLLQFVHLAQHVWRSVRVDTQGVPDARSRNHPVARPRVRGRLHCEAVGDADGGYQEQSHHLSRRSLAQVLGRPLTRSLISHTRSEPTRPMWGSSAGRQGGTPTCRGWLDHVSWARASFRSVVRAATSTGMTDRGPARVKLLNLSLCARLPCGSSQAIAGAGCRRRHAAGRDLMLGCLG